MQTLRNPVHVGAARALTLVLLVLSACVDTPLDPATVDTAAVDTAAVDPVSEEAAVDPVAAAEQRFHEDVGDITEETWTREDAEAYVAATGKGGQSVVGEDLDQKGYFNDCVCLDPTQVRDCRSGHCICYRQVWGSRMHTCSKWPYVFWCPAYQSYRC